MGKYRSPLEKRLAHSHLKEWDYEPFQIGYYIYSNYTPDFVQGNVCIEVKGFFRQGDTKKYLAIDHELRTSWDSRLVFIFSNPNKPIRKGTKLTMGQWADKHDIPWYTEDTFNEEALRRRFNNS